MKFFEQPNPGSKNTRFVSENNKWELTECREPDGVLVFVFGPIIPSMSFRGSDFFRIEALKKSRHRIEEAISTYLELLDELNTMINEEGKPMSNGIKADGTRQVNIPLTGERVVAKLKNGLEVHGMYQDGRIYGKHCGVCCIDQVESWRPDETAGR